MEGEAEALHLTWRTSCGSDLGGGVTGREEWVKGWREGGRVFESPDATLFTPKVLHSPRVTCEIHFHPTFVFLLLVKLVPFSLRT